MDLETPLETTRAGAGATETSAGPAEATAARTDEPVKVIYIMGHGRSGTTIFDTVLGQGEGGFSTGECVNILVHSFIGGNVCSCGAEARDCVIWGTVYKALDITDEEAQDHAKLRDKLEKDKALPYVALPFRSADKKKHLPFIVDTLRHIATVTGCNYIVDSSKYSARFLYLQRDPALEMHPICMTREPVMVWKSFQKYKKPPSMLWFFAYYAGVLTTMRVTRWALKRKPIVLRYEQFMSDPDAVLGQVERYAGVDLSPIKYKIANRVPFAAEHVLAGNQLRNEAQVLEVKDTKVSTREMPFRLRVPLWLLSGYRRLLGF